MKKILGLILGACLLVVSCRASSNIEQPALPVKLEKFEFIEQSVFSCGILTTYQHLEAGLDLEKRIEVVEWFAVFLDKSKFPKPLVVGVAKGDTVTYWLDRNRDGVFDEFYNDKAELVFKYQTPCDVVVK